MKQVLYIIILSFLAATAGAQQLTLFETEDFGVAFFADSEWSRIIGDSEGLELVNQNHNLHVRMFEVESAETPANFLSEMLLKEGFSHEDDPFEVIVDGRTAHAVMGQCCEMRRPVKVLLIAIESNEGYYLVRFKCPAECFREHRKMMSELISSIRLVNTAAPFQLYASHSTSS